MLGKLILTGLSEYKKDVLNPLITYFTILFKWITHHCLSKLVKRQYLLSVAKGGNLGEAMIIMYRKVHDTLKNTILNIA